MSAASFADLTLPLGVGLVFLPFTVKFVTLAVSGRMGSYDTKDNNHHDPRGALKSTVEKMKESGNEFLAGIVQRCQSCHQNAWEALIIMSAAVLLAKTNGVSPDTIGQLGAAWVGLRCLYTAVYIFQVTSWMPWLRSTVYGAGLGCSVALFVEAVGQ